MDNAIGLSLLVAEITEPPYGAHFITFSADHKMESVDLSKGIVDKVATLESSDWGGNTDFVAVFERLILPAAEKTKLRPEDMVKTVLVFSDMQFGASQGGGSYGSSFIQSTWSRIRGWDKAQDDAGKTDWETSFERIKRKYSDAGYELPHLVFWNLAGGRAGYGGGGGGDTTAPKPVTMDEAGCTLVSEYSQAMLKMFLDEGTFGEEGQEEMKEVSVGKDGAVETKTVKKKNDSMDGLWKAIGHKSYDMLRVYDKVSWRCFVYGKADVMMSSAR